LWVAQGKTNFEAAVILNISAATVKKHLENIYAKLGVEGRNAASLRALEMLGGRGGSK
jgi:DNA-binding CsgD family transcriptional regulator